MYETTLVTRRRERGPEVAFRMMTLPRRMVDEPGLVLLRSPEAFVQGTGLDVNYLEPVEVAQLADVLFAVLATDGPEVMTRWNDREWLAARRRDDPELDGFAQYLAFAEVVPFEQSKVSTTSLAALAIGSATAVAAKSIPAIAARDSAGK